MLLRYVEETATLYTSKGAALVANVKKTSIKWRDRETEELDEQFENDDALAESRRVIKELGWVWPRTYGAEQSMIDVDMLINGETVRAVGPDTISIPDLHRPRETCAHCGEEWPCADYRAAHTPSQVERQHRWVDHVDHPNQPAMWEWLRLRRETSA